MSQALYRKWRPTTFDEVVGQEHITRTLQNSIAAGRVGHAYLFCGPRGTGKTTTARLLAKAVNCLFEDPAQRPCNHCAVCTAVNEGRFLDLIEIDAASNTGVDDIRDLRDRINFAPNQGRFKVYIIDEVHMLSQAAFNALLKTLEEPPAHAMFILATTEEHKVPATIKSRCQQFNFRLLSVAEITYRLQDLASKEDLTIDPPALDLIARQGAGSLRDAESLLDQLVVAPGDLISLERAQQVLGTASSEAVIELTDAWLNADGAQGLFIIFEMLSAGTDPRQFARQMVEHLRTLLILQATADEVVLDLTDAQKDAMRIQAQRASREALIDTVRAFHAAAQAQAVSWQPQLPLELAFLSSLPAEPAIGYQRKAKEVRPVEEAAVKESPSAPQPPSSEAAKETATQREPETATEEPVPTSQETLPSELEAVQTTRTAAAPDFTLETIKAQWRTMVSDVGQANKNLPPLLAMCKPLAVEGHVVVLGFDFPIFKEKFDKTEGAAAAIGDAFSQLTGVQCSTRSEVTS
ncbi:MAG: DNA polymerase III subunit gamma/tau, partial [Candidatus Promineifilaceae bacterium]